MAGVMDLLNVRHFSAFQAVKSLNLLEVVGKFVDLCPFIAFASFLLVLQVEHGVFSVLKLFSDRQEFILHQLDLVFEELDIVICIQVG